MWLPPGGHIDEGELPDEAVLREIREETGLEAEIVSKRRAPDPSDGKVRYLHVPDHVQLEDIPGHGQHIDLIYFCRVKSTEVALAPREHERFLWLSEGDLASAPLAEEVRRSAAEAIRCVGSIREDVVES